MICKKFTVDGARMFETGNIKDMIKGGLIMPDNSVKKEFEVGPASFDNKNNVMIRYVSAIDLPGGIN